MPISSHELVHFVRPAFVECGSASGLGVSSALKAGFPKVYSVDINPECFEHCHRIFQNDQRVNLYHDDCGHWLELILNEIKVLSTIYLDANGWKHETESPFHASINALIRHGGRDHVLLVDDINHALRPRAEIIQDLKSSDMVVQLRRVNPNYTLYLIDTHSENRVHFYPSWVLVADPLKNRFTNLDPSEYI